MEVESVTSGSGMSDGVRAALAAVLRCVVPTMFKAQQPWAIMGSTASVLQGIDDYVPPDIDLVCTMEGAYIMEGCFGSLGATVRPVGYSESERYASHFGVFEVQGIRCEVMGDLVITESDGQIQTTDHFAQWSDKVRILRFDGFHIPVVPLEWQLIANVLLGRPERVEGIRRFLLEHGFDREYLKAMLADEQLGRRTIEAVKRAVQIDD